MASGVRAEAEGSSYECSEDAKRSKSSLDATFWRPDGLLAVYSSLMEVTMSPGVNSFARGAAVACFTLTVACSGAPKPMPLDAYHVDFATDSYAIDRAGWQAIDSVAQAVAGNSEARVTIVGRTDPTGSAAYNVQLSQKRAAAVHDALVSTGKIMPNQIETSWAAEQTQSAAAAVRPPAGDKVVNIYVQE